MLSNLRDGLTDETYVRVMGMKGQATPEFVKVKKEDLVGHYDFEVFDGTLPSERFHSAQALEDLLQGLMANPQLAMLLGLDIKKLLLEVLFLRGIRNPERFELRPEQQQADPNVIQPTIGGATPGGRGDASAGVPSTLPESLLSVFAPGANVGGSGGNGQSVPRFPGAGQ